MFVAVVMTFGASMLMFFVGYAEGYARRKGEEDDRVDMLKRRDAALARMRAVSSGD